MPIPIDYNFQAKVPEFSTDLGAGRGVVGVVCKDAKTCSCSPGPVRKSPCGLFWAPPLLGIRCKKSPPGERYGGPGRTSDIPPGLTGGKPPGGRSNPPGAGRTLPGGQEIHSRLSSPITIVPVFDPIGYSCIYLCIYFTPVGIELGIT